MKSDITEAVEAQKKISKLNDYIFETEIKIKNLEKIKDNKQLFIREYFDKDSPQYCYNSDYFGARAHYIKSIKIYNYRNIEHHETVCVDITKYFVSVFYKESDFLRKLTYMIVNENDPLWDILITDYIKALKDAVAESKSEIETIKNNKKDESE